MTNHEIVSLAKTMGQEKFNITFDKEIKKKNKKTYIESEKGCNLIIYWDEKGKVSGYDICLKNQQKNQQ